MKRKGLPISLVLSALEELSTALFPLWLVPAGNQKSGQESQGTTKGPDGEVVESPSLEIFTAQGDTVLGNLL